MQFTYHNDTKGPVSLYRGKLEDYVGYATEGTMITFELDVPPGYGIVISHIGQKSLIISSIELQTAPKHEKPVEIKQVEAEPFIPAFPYCGDGYSEM